MSAKKRRSLLGTRPASGSPDPAPSRDQGPFRVDDEVMGDAAELPTETQPRSSPSLADYDAPPPASLAPASGRAPLAPPPPSVRAEPVPLTPPAYVGVVYEEVPAARPERELVIGGDATDEIRATEPSYVAAGGGAKMDTSAVGWGSSGASAIGESPLAGRGAPYKTESAVYRAPTPPPEPGTPPLSAVQRRGKPFDKTGDPLEDSPPTEEVPIGGVMNELSPPLGAPIDIPHAPPLGGIVDRFTPSAVNRNDTGNRSAARPKYLADDQEEGKAKLENKEIGLGLGAARQRRAIAPPEPDAAMSMVTRVAMGLAVVSVLVIVGGGIAMMLSPGDGGDGGEAAPTEHDGVPIKRTMRGGQPPPAGEPVQIPAPAGVPVAAPAPLDGSPVSAPPSPGAAPLPSPGPAPEAPPAPAAVVEAPLPAPPPPKPPAPAAAPAATSGVIKITSNRRVLVYVNGAPIGYAPTEHKGKPGTYSISAMVPGQPETKQTRDVKIESAESKVALNFNF